MSEHPERDVICGKCGKAPPETTNVATVTCPWCGAVAQWIGDPKSWHRPAPEPETDAEPLVKPRSR